MIEFSGLYKRFGSAEVIKGINLSIGKGEVLAIIGPSGSGKSTLLRCINLLEIPTSGRMRIGDISLQFQENTKINKKDLWAVRRKTGMVFQAYHLFPHLTALQNVMEGPVTVRRLSKEKARVHAQDLLRKVGLEDRAYAYPHQLSGGQQQRVGIARAMAMDPEILLFDEPTSALDPELVGDVLKVIREVAAEGMTMAIVTHEMKFAEEVADRVAFVDDGRIVEEGSPGELFKNPAEERTRQFLFRLADRAAE